MRVFFVKIMLITGIAQAAYSQVPVTEKSYDISKGVRKGNLKGVVVNESTGTFDMVYMYNTGKKGFIGQEIYSYDKDLNLITRLDLSK